MDVESLQHPPGTGGMGQGDALALLSDFRRRWDRLEEEMVSRQVPGARLARGVLPPWAWGLWGWWHPSC